MPNNVVNELIFRNISTEIQEKILAKVRGPVRLIDFETLLPAPLNIWNGNVGGRHEQRFPSTHLDWACANWGTKWNAYGLDEDEIYRPIVQAGNTLILTFQTAWSPPMGWIVALFNFFGLSFDHNWLDEGDERGHADRFIAKELDNDFAEPWIEEVAGDEMYKHLHTLLWGCESFEDDDGEDAERLADEAGGNA
ncbi:MAG: hypothetical protein WC344_05235 [Bacilli bacterium]|jgi:hypothetical protein